METISPSARPGQFTGPGLPVLWWHGMGRFETVRDSPTLIDLFWRARTYSALRG